MFFLKKHSSCSLYLNPFLKLFIIHIQMYFIFIIHFLGEKYQY